MMRKIVLLLVLLTLSFSVYGQKVLGIDINTTGKNFAASLLKKGYKPIEKVAGQTTYMVTYAGYRNAYMEVRMDEANDSITEVSIKFKDRSKSEVSDIFDNLERQFKAKYPKGKSDRFDYGIINSHSRRWYVNDGSTYVHMSFDEVNGKFYINYRARHTKKENAVKPSDDI